MSTSTPRTHWVSVGLYIFSGLALALGVLLLVSLIGASNAVPANQIFFQMMGLGEMAGLVLRPLQSALLNLGILLFVLMSAIAALLFTAGRLAAAQRSLLERVHQLEEKVEAMVK